MADTPQTPEAVAYQLMRDVLAIEGASSALRDSGGPDRSWLLTTYSECLRTVRPDIPKAGPTHGRSAF
ncbi:MAG: hypothetical protein V4514_06840 [Pseudomonadota bacterium]|uniref:hypothetical protein n=1 Tax=unclassified Phenylobacterium TaxID=2640670 RepID=UPI0006F2FC69|nr:MULTISPECIES: hypothetical protein [unclassified Phenylobacterium]KRB46603.1 hypothetical protein ASE02_19185 [Phenylobacterium sp. Root700]MBT9470474.1 hypothetical protein [Phenylobacterium sp.]